MIRALLKIVKLLGAFCVATAMACWFQYNGIQMSWAGKRPLTPNASTGEIIPFENHGRMYVSQADLDFAHYFIIPGLIFGAVGLLLIAVDYFVSEPAVPIESSSTMKTLGTLAEFAFIGFMPIWLFANPFEALPNVVRRADQLLVANIVIGVLMTGWWLLMKHGSLFQRRAATAPSSTG